MSFVDSIVEQVLRIELGIHHSCVRLLCRTDDEALHDLRIGLRRLRSLLRPIRNLDPVRELDAAAAEVGRLTTPIRDLEVMIIELQRQGLPDLAQPRRQRLEQGYRMVEDSPTMRRLMACLDDWPESFRDAQRAGELRALRDFIRKRLKKQRDLLVAALQDPAYDRHALRILIKRMRYAHEAYPSLSPISPKAVASLKAVQGALGDWHDHFQWCLKVDAERDLEPLRRPWEIAMDASLKAAEAELQNLLERLQAH